MRKYLNIANLVLWLYLFVAVVFATQDVDLYKVSIACILVILVDIVCDIWNDRRKSNGTL